MARTRQERQQEAQEFLRRLSRWVQQEFSEIADLPTTSALVDPLADDLLDLLARWIDRGVDASAVEIARQRLADAYRSARAAATSRRRSLRKIRKVRTIRKLRSPGGDE